MPHVSNYDTVSALMIDGKPIRERHDVRVINLRSYDKWTDVIDDIASCDAILSSSLHGLIVAEAYGIPNVWIEFGKPLIGGHFKFHDFFLSIGRDRECPMKVANGELFTEDIDQELSCWEKGKIDLRPLLKACPFPIKKKLFNLE